MRIRRSAGRTISVLTAAAAIAGLGFAEQAQAASSDSYIWNSDISIGSCKAWMNGNGSNHTVQGLAESWGDTCEMRLWLSKDGGRTWYHGSYAYTVSSGHRTDHTGWHSSPKGWAHQAHVCLTNYTDNPPLALCGGTFHF